MMKTRWRGLMAALVALAAAAYAVAAEPVRVLPLPPGQILDLRANAAGDLYVRTSTNLLWMDLRHPEEGWIKLALDGVLDLTGNTGREVFALQDRKTRLAIHRLAGATADLVTTTPNVPCEHWYVDALGRAWLQNRDRLLVVGKNETLLEWSMGQPGYGIRFRQPCEWKPGHVVLFFASIAVWATPEKVTAEAAPSFADDGTGNGPFLIGTNRLASGGCNDKGAGSFLLDPRTPGKEPERLNLGRGDWFRGVATAPDGRLLCRPHRGFVWYAADGRSEVQLKESGPILDGASLAEPGKSRVVFAATGVGFAALPGGMLAVFRPDEAVMLTPATGLPVATVEHLAAVGDDLIMAGGGKIVVWRTTEPLPKPVATDLPEGPSAGPGAGDDSGTQAWTLAGPCVRDVNGTLWAFLLDAPGKISHHDGKQWGAIPIELRNLIPNEMTCDDKGMLQIAAAHAPSGSALFRSGAVTNWPNQPVRAWAESMRQGATRFGDGSPFRLRRMAAGRAEWFWLYDGRSLWDGEQEYDYYETPPYRYVWLGPDGLCYRGGTDRVWVFANGCWTETAAPTLTIGPDGIRADTEGKDRLRVVYDGQLKLLLEAKPRYLTLQGNEAFIPAPDGGGWVGQYRVFRNAYYPLAGRVYPGTNGHYLVEGNTLRFQPRQTLEVHGDVREDGNERRLTCRISGVEPPYKQRLLVFLDGEFQEALTSPDGANLPPLQPGLHPLEVYAADGFGVVATEPLRLTVDGGPLVKAEVLPLDDAWSLKPQRLQALPAMAAARSVLGQTLEFDADGVVWILVEGGVLSLDLPNRQTAFHPFPARGLLSARGRVWAWGDYDKSRTRVPLYELRRDGPRHAVDLDGAPRAADPAGGIWVLGSRFAARWDGYRTQYWERNFGSAPEMLPHLEGVVIQSPWDGFCYVYRNGELGTAISGYKKISGFHSQGLRTSAWTLGRNHLVMLPTGEVVDLGSGRAMDMKFPYGVYSRRDSRGNLYYWDKGKLFRISGEDLKQTLLGTARRPMSQSEWGSGGRGWYDEFAASPDGTVVYSAGPDRLVALRPGEEAAEYGMAQGVLPGRVRAIREAPDGRLWILRSEQLLVYDPAQPADAIPTGWPGWRGILISPIVMVGAMGRFWFEPESHPWLNCTDGTNETAWSLGVSGEIIVSDQGNGVVFSGNDTYFITPDRKFTQGRDRQAAILELLKLGGRQFGGDRPPVVAADGRVCFRGAISAGKEWRWLPDGRVSLDLRGAPYLLSLPERAPPQAYRIDGVDAVSLGDAERCLVDADGLRWYDSGLMEAQPGTLPVWHAGGGTPQISATLTSQRTAVKRNAAMQAFPLGDGRFLVRVDSELHVLDANGLTPLPKDSVPFSGGAKKVYRLANGQWVFVSMSGILYISPPDLRIAP